MDDDTKVLVRDLDLTITGPPSSTTYWPWTLDGSDPSAEAVQTRRNSVDNVEQVQVDAPPVGCYTVRVSHTGGTFTQPYALLITGASLDVTPPVITCPPDIDQPADPGKCGATIDVGTATATDNCGVDTIVGTRSDGLELTDDYPVGTTTITWVATDVRGYTDECLQTVTVTSNEIATFDFTEITTPQCRERLFEVTITATGCDGLTVTSFNGPVSLSATDRPGLPVPVLPQTVQVVSGASTGNVTVSGDRVYVVLHADDGAGHEGDSNEFYVDFCSLGSVELDAEAYNCASLVGIEVRDRDLAGSTLLVDELDGSNLGSASQPTVFNYTPGVAGGAALFEGPTDYIAYSTDYFGAAGTVDFYIKGTSDGAELSVFDTVGTRSADHGDIRLMLNTANQLSLRVRNGVNGRWHRFTNDVVISPDAWIPVSFSYGPPDGMRLCVDDSCSGVWKYGNVVAARPGKTVYLGDYADDAPGLSFAGAIDGLRASSTGTVSVTVTTEGGDSETVALFEDGPSSGVLTNYHGRLGTDPGSAYEDDGVLQVVHGETVTVTYVDADDGLGGADVRITDTATIGCQGEEIIIGDGTRSAPLPLFTSYNDARTQTIYLAEEIGSACRITALGLDVTWLPGQPLTNFTIRMRHTPLPSYTTKAWECSDWIVVYQNPAESIGFIGWNAFPLDTAFDYNGSDNLMVDFSFDNAYHTFWGECRYTVPGGTRSVFYATNSPDSDPPLTWCGTSPYSSGAVPNLKLLVHPVAD